MAIQIQLRQGSASEHSTFTGAVGEVTVDTTNKTLRVHDGATVGGFPLTSSGEVVDNLTTNVSNKPLSAKQGKVLNESKVSNPTKIPANANLNDYKTVGLYFCDTDTTTILNNPTQYGFSLIVEKVSDTAVNQKLVVHKDGGGKVYVRSFSTSWSDWNTITFEKDVLGGTYKNVTSTRLSGVTYTNTSGKTLLIKVSASYSSASANEINIYIGATVGGNNLLTLGCTLQTKGFTLERDLIIPNGSTYSFTAMTGANFGYVVQELS